MFENVDGRRMGDGRRIPTYTISSGMRKPKGSGEPKIDRKRGGKTILKSGEGWASSFVNVYQFVCICFFPLWF